MASQNLNIKEISILQRLYSLGINNLRLFKTIILNFMQSQTGSFRFYVVIFSLSLMRLKERYLALTNYLEFQKAIGNLPNEADPKCIDDFEAMVRVVEINDHGS